MNTSPLKGAGQKTGRRTAALLFVATLFLAVPLKAESDEPVAGLEEENLVPMIERRLEAIEVEGASLPGLCGKDIQSIRVFSSRGGLLAPIPFQIDERDPEGNLALSEGDEPTKDSDTRFDSNDLLLFQAQDLGSMVYSPETPKGEAFAHSLKVTDPLDRSAGWVYVISSPDPPPPNSGVYVRYMRAEGKRENVNTPYYGMNYPWGSFYTSVVYLYPPSGARGVDMVDRLKARGFFTLFFSLIKLKITEEDMAARMVGYRTGPIRVVRRVRYWSNLGMSIRSAEFVADIIYYATFVTAPVTTNVPIRLNLFFSKAYAEIGTDYNRNAFGMIFRNSFNPDGTLIDGRMSPQEMHLDLREDEWRVITGEQGTFFRGRSPENAMTSQVKTTLVYLDDIGVDDPPESEPGQVGHIFDRSDVLQLKPGIYRSDVRFMVAPDYRRGDEKMYLDWETHPLQVEVEDRSIE